MIRNEIKKMYQILQENVLFKGMTQIEIENCLKCARAHIREYDKNAIIFSQMDPPASLYVLITGNVAVCKDSIDGKRYIVTTIEERDIFGEVFVFLEHVEYTYYVVANEKSKVLEIPKEYFYHSCGNACDQHAKISYNLLTILARKAYFLNNKVQLLTSGSLRQKIIKYLFELNDGTSYIKLPMNREQLADYLNVTRPSLSRELIKMNHEKLIDVHQNVVKLIDIDALKSYL